MSRNTIVTLMVISLGILFWRGFMTLTQPRGIRNHNPLNIKEAPNGGDKWLGERATDDDKTFEEFESPEYGIRAGAKILKRYFDSYGLVTLDEIITRWAPASDNNHTQNYIQFVAKQSGLDPMVDFVWDEHFPNVIKAMIQFENGQQPYSDEIILKGCRMAGIQV